MIQVKVCGIRREEDAVLAAKYGADAVGLLVGQRHNSPDFITAELAGRISRRLPPAVSAVLVTHVPELDEIETLLQTTGLTRVQLHSEISPSAITELRRRLPDLIIFKSVHVVSVDSLEYPENFREAVDGFVLDSINVAADQIGGTRMVHDWSISREIVARYHDMPIFLAGGLNSANVATAIKYVRPFGVDVNSGIKGADGYKDAQRLQDFIDQAKRADVDAYGPLARTGLATLPIVCLPIADGFRTKDGIGSYYRQLRVLYGKARRGQVGSHLSARHLDR